MFARKFHKIPELYMIFARKMPEFYTIIARKIFSRILGGGGHVPPPLKGAFKGLARAFASPFPPSPMPMVLLNYFRPSRPTCQSR